MPEAGAVNVADQRNAKLSPGMLEVPVKGPASLASPVTVVAALNELKSGKVKGPTR